MSKESWKSAREVTATALAGAAEGAIITSVWLPGTLPVSAVAGGLAGGITALTTELIGRSQKRTVTVRHTAEQTFTDESKGTTQTLTTDVTSQKTVPAIKVADTKIWEHMVNWSKASGDLQQWHFQTLVTKDVPPPTAIREAKIKGFDFHK